MTIKGVPLLLLRETMTMRNEAAESLNGGKFLS